VLRRLIKASAIVIGVGLAAAGCAVTPLKMGAAAVAGSQRISIATLGIDVASLSQAVSQATKQYPGALSLNATQETQATLSWLIRYQVNDELARQQRITISPEQVQTALNQLYAAARSSAAQSGITNANDNLILAAYGIPPNTTNELGRWQAIATEYMKIVNGGTTPTSSSARTAASNKLNQAECLAAKALNIQVNPQFGQLDYSRYQVVAAPVTVSRSAGPTTSASPVATAPAC
jgi:hypothetical protein